MHVLSLVFWDIEEGTSMVLITHVQVTTAHLIETGICMIFILLDEVNE